MAVGFVPHGGFGVGQDMGFELLGFAGMQLDSDDNCESGHMLLLGFGASGVTVAKIWRRPKLIIRSRYDIRTGEDTMARDAEIVRTADICDDFGDELLVCERAFNLHRPVHES